MRKKSSNRFNYRSAKTGRFVTKEYARKHPNTTVREKTKKDTDHTGPRIKH